MPLARCGHARAPGRGGRFVRGPGAEISLHYVWELHLVDKILCKPHASAGRPTLPSPSFGRDTYFICGWLGLLSDVYVWRRNVRVDAGKFRPVWFLAEAWRTLNSVC
jgi:hypothetical protein